MKYVKTLGLMAAAVAALMAFVGSASATTVTSNGSVYTGTVEGASEGGHVSLHGSNGVTVECSSSFKGSVQSHGASKTVFIKLFSFSFTNCTNGYTVHVTVYGEFGWHSLPDWVPLNNARITSLELLIEVTAKSLFGTITCTYTTNETEFGTLTGSVTTGGKATLDASATIPRTGGSSLCGSTGTLTGNYVINTPSNLNVDA